MFIDTEKDKVILPLKKEISVPTRKPIIERNLTKDYNTQLVRELQLDEDLKDLDLKERFIKTI